MCRSTDKSSSIIYGIFPDGFEYMNDRVEDFRVWIRAKLSHGESRKAFHDFHYETCIYPRFYAPGIFNLGR